MKGRAALAAFDLPGWIARADTIGLSLYTERGFPDYGHASIYSTVRLVELARRMGKQVFVLEGGVEAPNVVLDERELSFCARVAAPLRPATYIYEYLKEKFYEHYPSNPGKLVTRTGAIQPEAVRVLRALFAQIQTQSPSPATPVLYGVWDSSAARENPHVGEVMNALLDLASDLEIGWMTPDMAQSASGDTAPQVNANGSILPPNTTLEKLFAGIPSIGTKARLAWKANVARALKSPAQLSR